MKKNLAKLRSLICRKIKVSVFRDKFFEKFEKNKKAL
jgi:hypothetical protein